MGYRLKALIETDHVQPAVVATVPTTSPGEARRWEFPRWRLGPLIGIGLASVALAILLMTGAQPLFSSKKPQSEIVDAIFAQPIRSTDVVDALLNVDEERLRLYVRRGWNPNWHLDSESNAALHTLMLACERNPTHDKAAVLRAAQMLVRAGADTNAKNGWGDTPLSIASSRRYCGPDHPVVAYLRDSAAHPR